MCNGLQTVLFQYTK